MLITTLLTKALNLHRDNLLKANAQKGKEKTDHKYTRRVPDGKGGWRYFYGPASLGRAPVEGEELNLDGKHVAIHAVDDEKVTIRHDDGRTEDLTHEDWHRRMTWQYGDKYVQSAEKRARQWSNAIFAHVPQAMLHDLHGDTDAARLADLKLRAPDVYAHLEPALKRAGVSAFTARSAIIWTLQRKGWSPEARAALLGATLDETTKAIHNYREMSAAAERLATPVGIATGRPGINVQPQHVAAAIELFNRKKTSNETRQKLAAAQKVLAETRLSKNPAAMSKALLALFESPEIAEMIALSRAYPQTIKTDPEVAKTRSTVLQAKVLEQPVQPVKDGADTNVYIAGDDGKPVALPGRYKLVEMGDAIASHNPGGWNKNAAYPEGLQERAYHRDKSEQAKVENNAQTMRPEFTINTNPDATNGPPIMDSKNIVLGGNSRTMTLQLVYQRGGENADKYRNYLSEHAHDFGLRPEDVAALKQPMLVREVDTFGHDPKLLVRQLNENFTQAMDPRTMQVAMGRKLDDRALSTLASSMAEDETLSKFLSGSNAGDFVSSLQSAGIIDRRNMNQYMSHGKLNEDGKTLVERVLVGKVVDDADMLSDTMSSMVSAVAKAVPYIIQAEAGGKGYDIRQDLKTAIDAYNQIRRVDALPNDRQLKQSPEYIKKITDNGVQLIGDLFDGDHPVTASPRARALLDVLIQRSGPVQIANIFREYARMAKLNPEGQAGMFGDTTPDDVFRLSIAAATDKEAKKEADDRPDVLQPVAEASGMGLFASLRAHFSTGRGLR